MSVFLFLSLFSVPLGASRSSHWYVSHICAKINDNRSIGGATEELSGPRLCDIRLHSTAPQMAA